MRSVSPPGIDLSTLGKESRDASAALGGILEDAISAAGGVLPFESYMEIVLYTPDFGYYARAHDIFGSTGGGDRGDFVTAPELSPVFSRCVATQVASVLADTGGDIAEFGAGSGRMAFDLLSALPERYWPRHYWIVEKSASLSDQQKQTLQALPHSLRERVRWTQQLPSMSGVVLANELLDALAVQRFIVTDDGPRPLGVVAKEGQFSWHPMPAEPELSEWYENLVPGLDAPLTVGYVSERCRSLSVQLELMSQSLQRGLMLLFDYGYPRHEYYHRERGDGTLLCHFQQRAHGDPFFLPGLQDITASVDFTAVAESALNLGLSVNGYTTQAWFLMGCGLDTELARLSELDEAVAIGALQAAKRLVLPGEMGERIQVMALGREYDQLPLGMQLRDQRNRLGVLA